MIMEQNPGVFIQIAGNSILFLLHKILYSSLRFEQQHLSHYRTYFDDS